MTGSSPWKRPHLPEDHLKPPGLPAALLPPLPGLAGHQSDVVTLQQHNSRFGRATNTQNRRVLVSGAPQGSVPRPRPFPPSPGSFIGLVCVTFVDRRTHDNLDVPIVQDRPSWTCYIGDGEFQLPSVRADLKQREDTSVLLPGQTGPADAGARWRLGAAQLQQIQLESPVEPVGSRRRFRSETQKLR